MPKLSDDVINYVNAIEYFVGKTKIDINPNRVICGITMPVSYQVTVQKLQQQLLSLSNFDKVNEPKGNPGQDFFADFGFLNQ